MTEKDRQETGRLGEALAEELLRNKGYEILGRNIHVGHGELDIVAKTGQFLVFVEVKTRHGLPGVKSVYGTPEDAVNWKKQENLVKSAEEYRRRHPEYEEYFPRIDVISILMDRGDGVYSVEHYENAVRKRNVKKRADKYRTQN